MARRWYNSRLAITGQSVLIGLITGFVVVSFRYCLSRADILRAQLYQVLNGRGWHWMLGLCLAWTLLGLLLGWMMMRRPMIRGSGIPQIKGALVRQLSLNWAPELPFKWIAGVLGLGAGLSLGREGPSIQLGAYVGKGVLSALRRPGQDRKYLLTAASAAGLAAAFNAPLAGVLFVLEELQAPFSPLLIACAMAASMTADAVAVYFFGLKPVFDFRQIPVLSLEAIPWIALLGILCGLLGALFKRMLYRGQDLYAKLPVPPVFRPALPLLASIPLGFFCFDLTGGGHSLIESLPAVSRSLGMLGLLLAGKMLFTVFSYGCGTAGGIFLPLLACGALSGEGFGKILVHGGLLAPGMELNYMILGMSAFFTGVIKAPVTGIILILEMTGNFNHLGNLVLAGLSAYVTTELIASRPVYEVLLERFLVSTGKPAARQDREGCDPDSLRMPL
jgi:H+/Cl- antiporter ClcA